PLPHPSPLCTLIPYTTLFRSGEFDPRGLAGGGEHPADGQRRFQHPAAKLLVAGGDGVGDDLELGRAAGALAVEGEVLFPAVVQIDRKSTRLNSSHVSISYAVF